jgi:tetratricopeptide (TPR) repeat protein
MSRRIKLVDKNGGYSLRLLELVCDVKIKGFLSECTTTLKFRNEQNSEIVESELSFPLNEGATICGYAADINGVVVDAVVVEKQKAREVFDNETKKFEKKKAALAEQVVGNVFSTSINCTAPLAVRTIKLVFIQPLKFDSKATTYTYKLPFQLSEPIPHFGLTSTVKLVAGLTSARLTINSPAVRQNVSNLLDSAGHFPFQSMGDYYALNFNLNDVTFDGEDLLIRTAFNPQVKNLALVEHVNKELFFAVHDWSKINRISSNATSKSIGSPKVAVYWQRSFNLRDEFSTGRQIELLGKILQEMQKQSVTNCDLMTFGETVESHAIYSLDYNSLTAIADGIRKLEYEGALDLESLSMHLKALVEDNPNTYRSIFVFTDGINALGPTHITAPSLGVPLHIISGPEKCNPTLMGSWAKANGGKFINLNEMSNNSDVITAVTSNNGQTKFGLVSADVNVTGETSIYPRQMLDLTEDGVSIYGSLSTETVPKNAQLKVTLKYGKGGVAVEETVISLAVKLPQQDDTVMQDVESDDTNAHFIGKYWANVKIKHLGEEKNKDELKDQFVALGRRFGIVSEYTSYLILENLEEYVKYEIEPPRSLHTVWQQYQDIMMARKLRADKQQDNKLTTVESLWNRKVKWWQNEHIKSKTDGLVLHFLPLDVEAKDSFNNPYWQDSKTRPLDLSVEQELSEIAAFSRKLSLKRKDPEPWSEFEICQTETYEAVRKKQLTATKYITNMVQSVKNAVSPIVPLRSRSRSPSPVSYVTASYGKRISRSRSRSRSRSPRRRYRPTSPPRKRRRYHDREPDSSPPRRDRERDRDREVDRRRSRSRSRSPAYRRRSRSRSRSRSPRRYRSRSRSRSRSPNRRRASRSCSISSSRSRSRSPVSESDSSSSASSSDDESSPIASPRASFSRGGRGGSRGGRGGGPSGRGGRGGFRGRGGARFDSVDWNLSGDKKDKDVDATWGFQSDVKTRAVNQLGDEMIVTTTSPYESKTFSNSTKTATTTSTSTGARGRGLGGKGLGKGGAMRHRKVLRLSDSSESEDDSRKVKKSKDKDLTAPVPSAPSPPMKLVAEERERGKIPAATSNWKNAAGYTIPLNQRSHLAELGEVNGQFAKLSSALNVAETKAREEISARKPAAAVPLPAPTTGLIAARRTGKVVRKQKKAEPERWEMSQLTPAGAFPVSENFEQSLELSADEPMFLKGSLVTGGDRFEPKRVVAPEGSISRAAQSINLMQLERDDQRRKRDEPKVLQRKMEREEERNKQAEPVKKSFSFGLGAQQQPQQVFDLWPQDLQSQQQQMMQHAQVHTLLPPQPIMPTMPTPVISQPVLNAPVFESFYSMPRTGASSVASDPFDDMPSLGEPMEAKEAFRRLSHKFHGKMDKNVATTIEEKPIDMDDDEKQLLQAARGRLLMITKNRAKRKKRELQLEEEQRLKALKVPRVTLSGMLRNEVEREERAESAAQVTERIEKELRERLEQGTYSYNAGLQTLREKARAPYIQNRNASGVSVLMDEESLDYDIPVYTPPKRSPRPVDMFLDNEAEEDEGDEEDNADYGIDYGEGESEAMPKDQRYSGVWQDPLYALTPVNDQFSALNSYGYLSNMDQEFAIYDPKARSMAGKFDQGPPAGYKAGLGRGAADFNVRSDDRPSNRSALVSWNLSEAPKEPTAMERLASETTYHKRVKTSVHRALTLMKDSSHMSTLQKLLKATPSSRHAEFLSDLRQQTDHVTVCFVVGTLFITQGHYKEALRILTSAVASVTDDPKLWRALAFRLEEFAHFKPHSGVTNNETLNTYQQIAARLARGLWRRLVEARANEPHGYRNLALALIDQFNREPEGNENIVDEAVKHLTKIAAHAWSDRFAAMQIEVNALEELNALVNSTHFTQKGLVNAQQWRLKALELNPRLAPLLAQALPCDLRVTIEWDREEANVELHVTEPSNEVCCPMNNSTSSGAMLSVDCAGLGPVTYMLRQATSGEYVVAVKLFHAMDLSRPVHVRVKVQCFFATPHLEVTEVHTVALYKNKQLAQVSRVTFL